MTITLYSQTAVSVSASGGGGVVATNGVGMVAPISGHSPGLVRAQVSHGVRQVAQKILFELEKYLSFVSYICVCGEVGRPFVKKFRREMF